MPDGTKPIAIRVRLPYGTEREFADGYASHMSRIGIFVATDRPWLVGTFLTFEFLLGSGQAILRGEAVVATTVEAAPDVTPGVTLRYLELDDDSRDVIDRLYPPPAGARSWVLGIDLGTNATRVAVVRGRAGPEPVSFGRDGELPSALAVDAQGRLLLGTGAQTLSAQEPRHAATAAKRWLGSRFEPTAATQAPFRMVPDERGEAAAMLRGQRFAIARVCGELLRRARNLAEEQLGAQVTRAVIAVPTHFSAVQRAALLRAAAYAGLTVDLLVSDAAAAAVAYAAGRQLPRRRLVVLDLGAGTFDASVLQIEGDQLEVIATGGDGHFGGLDFDDRIAGVLADRLDAKGAGDAWDGQQRLRRVAETAKIALSNAEETQVSLSSRALPVRLTRTELDAACGSLVERLAAAAGEMLRAAKLAPRDIDEVLLLGGMTHMPAIRRRLDQLFAKAPILDMTGSPAVATGAALLGASAQRDRDTLGLREVLGSTLSVQLPDGQLKSVFSRHTPLPAERHLDLEGPPGATDLRVPIFQAAETGRDSPLGVLELRGLAPGLSGGVRSVLTLSLSRDALLQATVAAGGGQRPVELKTLDPMELPIAVIEGEGAEPAPLLRRAGGG
jgi:molecular chaperone DnaK